MKVVRIIARLNVGGPARHVVWLADGMRSAGYETLLVAGVVPPGEDDMSYLPAAAGITPLIIPEMSREISLKDILTTWKLFRLMRRERPAIVHTHTAKAGTVGRVAGLMYRWLTPTALSGRPRACSFVHTYHGHVFHSYYGPAKTRVFLGIERLLARLGTDRIVAVSEQQRREINERFRVGRPEQFAVIPLGIDTSAFTDWQTRRSKLRAELDTPEDDLLVGIVGRLTEVKNHALFLRAAAACLTRLKQRRVRFVIIGDGKLRSELETQAASLGLGDEVVFLGMRNDPENFYPALDIVALTSLNEGTPLTLIEAMANARPVIATDVGGVIDLLGETVPGSDAASGYLVCERGLLTKSEDADGMALGLMRLIDDESLRANLGARGRHFAASNYAKERLLADMTQLYSQLSTISPAATESASAQTESATGDYRARLTPRV